MRLTAWQRRLTAGTSVIGAGGAVCMPRPRRLLPLLAVACAFLAGPGHAQGRSGAASPTADDIGLVVNQTYTAGGLEFFRRFSDFWREKSDVDRYTLTILERPSRRFGNQVMVSLGQRPVYVAALPLKADAIRNASLEAVEQVYASAVASNLRFNDRPDPDMGREEW